MRRLIEMGRIILDNRCSSNTGLSIMGTCENASQSHVILSIG